MNLLALVSVPGLMNEDVSVMIKTTEDDSYMNPYILSQNPLGGSLQILADGVTICETNNLMKAARLLLATFYIFNIAYPKIIMATLTFFQKVFLNLQDEARRLPKVISLTSKLASKQDNL